jgi:transposase
MAEQERMKVLTDAQWDQLAPLIEACRPHGKTEPQDLRRTIEAIIWRHENGAKWRSIPAELGPWWMAAQMFNRWSHMAVWERLLELAQQRGGVKMGMTFLDGTNIRAHQKAAGAAKKGGLQRSVTSVRRLAVHVAAGSMQTCGVHYAAAVIVSSSFAGRKPG